MKKYKTYTLGILMILMTFSGLITAQAEENSETELPEIEEETTEIFDGMEIYPNLEGSEFYDESLSGVPPNAGGVHLENEPVTYALPNGGPYVGYLNGKGGGSTVDVYDQSTGGTKMTYIGNGTTSGVFAILDHQNSRYKIALSGLIGWIDQSVVNLYTFNEKTMEHNFFIPTGGVLYHKIPSNPISSIAWYSSLSYGDAPSYLTSGKQYLSFDGHYFYPATTPGYNQLIKDYNAGHRNNSINKNDPYYNYFQWLPARSQSSLTASDLKNYLSSAGYNSPTKSRLYDTEQLFIDNGTFYGGNSALGFATAVHESGWGSSEFSRLRNNYFGHNAYDSSPGMASAYATPNFGIGVHFGRFWNWNYLNTHPKAFNNGGSVGNKTIGMNVKYASDPYWGEKIASHYYNMDKLAPASRRDYKRYTIGLYTNYGVNVRKGTTTSDDVVYTNKLEGMPIAIIEQKQGQNVGGNTLWYGFSADPMLDGNKNILNIGSLSNPASTPYNISKSTVYVHSSNIKVVSQGKNSTMMTQKNVILETTPTISKTPVSITTTKSTALKPDPSTARSTILNIPSGTRLSAYKTNNGYYQVIHGGHIGYVKESDIGGTTSPATRLLGDVNGDGNIDGFDMMAVKRHHLGYKKLTGIDFKAADINGDGIVDGFDMMAIKRHHLGYKKIQGEVK